MTSQIPKVDPAERLPAGAPAGTAETSLDSKLRLGSHAATGFGGLKALAGRPKRWAALPCVTTADAAVQANCAGGRP